MPAPLAKGILVTLSLLAALSIAIYENPQVKEWIEEQRRKIAEWLRTMGDELDPQSRREAEAFAYEGRMPRQEHLGARNAVAVATGREAEGHATSHRTTMRSSIVSSQDPIDATERRRLGREYLARKNQDMLDARRRSETKTAQLAKTDNNIEKDSSESSTLVDRPANRSFDDMVRSDGTLKLDERSFPSPPIADPTECVPMAAQPMAVLEPMPAMGASGVMAGLRYGNPFADEFELHETLLTERASTPKPPVPPKVSFDEKHAVYAAKAPEVVKEPVPEDLSYEEQLVRALSLSLSESEAQARTITQQQEEQDPALATAIAASLKEVDEQKMRQEREGLNVNQGDEAQDAAISSLYDLVNVTSDPPASVPYQAPSHTGAYSHSDEELYSVTPNMQHAQLATVSPTLSSSHASLAPHSAASGQLIDINDTPMQSAPPAASAALSPSHATATETSSFMSDSEFDDFASLPGSEPHSHGEFGSQSEGSVVEVEHVDMESIDSDEEDGDGIGWRGIV